MPERSWIERALRQCGICAEISGTEAVYGGDISEAYRVSAGGRFYFLKSNKGMPEKFFTTEAESLNLLSDVQGVYTPHVYGVFLIEDEQRSGIVMEWLTGASKQSYNRLAGKTLAALHNYQGSAFGFDTDTYIGKYQLKNGYHDNWCSFFRSYRLEPQWHIAKEKGLMTKDGNYKMEKLISKLDNLIPGTCIKPVLLHGDFWSGNWIAAPEGKVYLIDPSLCFGHHEMDLAFTELFGGFSHVFYESYREIIKTDNDYEDRKPLYQLFYLLVHLNTFGLSYQNNVLDVLDRYT